MNACLTQMYHGTDPDCKCLICDYMQAILPNSGYESPQYPKEIYQYVNTSYHKAKHILLITTQYAVLE